MELSSTAPPPPLAVHANVWIETNDQVVLSRWRVRLLETIDGTGSIRSAATQMKITYHLAWHRLDEMETALGTRLVERQRGGFRGGGAQLTASGRDYVARFNRFAAEMDAIVERLFGEAFSEGR